MSNMLAYSIAMLEAISEFLMAEPMIYLFGFIVLAIIFKVFAGFTKLTRK